MKNETFKILILDDDEAIRKILQRAILNLGHSIYGASSAAEALLIIDSIRLDLLVLDLWLPGAGAFEVTKQFFVANPKQKIVAVTGSPSNDEFFTVLLAQKKAVLIVKPFQIEDVKNALRSGLNN
jgi:CheY-like chemotaxis protein